jgi:hypothetical protein
LKKEFLLHPENEFFYEMSFEFSETYLQTLTSSSSLPNEGSQQPQRKRFIQSCTNNTCRGFLSTQWKCDLCQCWTCPHCHEFLGLTKDGLHECNPENVATAILLNKDSRPCPNCASLIFKIQGCNQMFCTQCKTGFDWVTGAISRGRIHNPHYFEYMNRVAIRAPTSNDNNEPICQENTIVVYDNIHQKEENIRRNIERAFQPFQNKPFQNEPFQNKWNERIKTDPFIRDILNKLPFVPFATRFPRATIIYRMYVHFTDVYLPKFQTTNLEERNRDLRMAYILGEITEEKLKKILQTRDKADNIKHEKYQIIEMFTHCCHDLLLNFINLPQPELQDIYNLYDQFIELAIYTNEQYNKMCNLLKLSEHKNTFRKELFLQL